MANNNRTTTSKPSTEKPINSSNPTAVPQFNVESTSIKLPYTSKVPSVVIITEKPEVNINGTNNISAMPNLEEMVLEMVDADKRPTINQDDEIPVHIIMEPLLMPKPHKQNNMTTSKRRPFVSSLRSKSKMTNTHSSGRVNCINGQYRTRLGNCRSRRSKL